MISYSIIQKSQLEGALRLDAEYYQPEYLEVAKILKKYQPLRNFVENIIHPQEVKREYSERGYLFVLSQNLRENYLDFSDKFYIDNETAKQIGKNLLSEGDIVTVRTGNIGLSAVVSGFKEKIYASADVIVIKKPKISPFYISTFLNSKYGKLYLSRIIYGALQPHITPKLLGEIPVPLPNETIIREIHNIVEQALDNFKQSESLYSQAENLLLEELGLKDFKVEDELSYIVNLSQIKSAHRADAEYFQPKYGKLISKIKNQNAKRLGELAKRVKIKIRPNPEETYKYIEISDISIGSGDVKFNEIVGKELPANARIPIKGGELIISKVRPTRGAISIVPSEFNNKFICSGAFSVFQAPEILKEYLFVTLRSVIGKLQFEKPTTGTSYPTITDEDVESTLIPLLPQLTQQKIADLVQKSHGARKKAKELLEDAKQKVEKLIESKEVNQIFARRRRAGS